jgi:AcrR family transcriptional regulator
VSGEVARAQPRDQLRDCILDAMRRELLTKDWSAITLADVARTAGVSRQTIYNEFGSRQGLAQGYALRLADRLVDDVSRAIDDHDGEIYASLLLSGDAKPDLLQIITTGSGPIITHCSERLTGALTDSWVRPGGDDAGVLARAIVRLALSYVSMPPEADHDVAADLARLMTPFAERYSGERNPDAVIGAPSG